MFFQPSYFQNVAFLHTPSFTVLNSKVYQMFYTKQQEDLLFYKTTIKN